MAKKNHLSSKSKPLSSESFVQIKTYFIYSPQHSSKAMMFTETARAGSL